MIKKITFNNFYSFCDEQIIDFTATKKNSYDYTAPQEKDKKQITKVASIISKNASGKTNIFRVLGFLQYIVASENRDSSGLLSPAYKTFFRNEEETNISIVFIVKGVEYTYSVSVQKGVIEKEKLSVVDFSKTSKKKITIFSKTRSRLSASYAQDALNLPKGFFREVRKDKSVLSYLYNYKQAPYIKDAYLFFHNLILNINEVGQLGLNKNSIVANYHNDGELKAQMEDFITKFDLGLSGFKIEENTDSFEIFGLHRTPKEDLEIPFKYESSGTRELFFIVGYVLLGIKTGSVIALDEIDRGLHPEALNALIRFYLEKNEDDGDGQLIFSSHSLQSVQQRDAQQIYLVEKDSFGKSSVYRLSDVEGVRTEDNFYRKYMAGAYGAFPNITL